ncbi:MAG: arginine--tRNA ligase [Patescibacteria group bacterium]
MKKKIISALKDATGEKKIHLELPENEEHGDFATNIAIVKAKKEGKNPSEYAKELVKKLQEDKTLTQIVSKIEVAGPGFINFFLSDNYLISELGTVIDKKDKYGSSDIGKGKTAVIEYSSPNIAKHFGVGHLRSTIIGQSLYNLYKFVGYKTIGDNHLGDWGTQFGMIIAQVVRKNLDPDKLTVEDYEKLYVEFNKEAKEDEKLMDLAREWFKKLEEGDEKARNIWQKAKDVSLKEFERIYKLLGVNIDHSYGESFYEDKMPEVIELAREKGLTKKSEGAEIIELKDMPPLILLKTDGATTYQTRDLATAKFRLDEWKPDIIIYEVGADQKLHFKQIFAAVKLLGWGEETDFVHVAHGLIRFEHGKMSTRRGETVKLEDVLKESIKRAREIIEKSETGRGLKDEEKEKIVKAVGIGAVKYFDLSHHYSSDIIFDWEKLFVLEGNSAPYLQYTIARTNSVLAKAKGDRDSKIGAAKFNREELILARNLVRFSEITIDAAKNYSPNLLCNFLFNLAQKYNNFYNQHKIIGGDNEELRILLTTATGQVLKNGLDLLGIESPERM